MKIIIKQGTGITIFEIENPTGKHLVWSEEFQSKIDAFVNPNINKEFTDIIESATPEQIEQSNNIFNAQLNIQQHEELQPFDWYFTRKIRNGKEVPQHILDEIKEIEDKFDALKR